MGDGSTGNLKSASFQVIAYASSVETAATNWGVTVYIYRKPYGYSPECVWSATLTSGQHAIPLDIKLNSKDYIWMEASGATGDKISASMRIFVKN